MRRGPGKSAQREKQEAGNVWHERIRCPTGKEGSQRREGEKGLLYSLR